jgi:hypothetical protein
MTVAHGRLPNPLDGFTSYSTQFVMLACRTTELARLFSQESDASTLQLIDSTPQLGAPVRYKGSDSDIFLVIDTRRFSQFTIERLNYEVLLNGVQIGKQHPNMYTAIEMTIIDSVGISFINYMQWLMDTKMQSGFDGMIFMLRTVFVGHHADGTSETVQTTTIPMFMTKMELGLDNVRGTYNVTFMPNFNFAADQNLRWLNIGTSTNFSTLKLNGNTLGAMVDSFEAALNSASTSFYNEISAKILNSGGAPADFKGKFGRPVFYQITIPAEWENFKFAGPSSHDAIEKSFVKAPPASQSAEQKNSTTGGKDVTPALNSFTSVDPGQDITTVLETIIKQCPQTRELANADRITHYGGFITFYRFLVSISSNKDNFTVHVDVVPFDIPNVAPQKTADRKIAASDDRFFKTEVDAHGNQTKVPRNYFELDYIFTGKNLDVLSFDMKTENLAFLLNTNVKVGEGQLFSLASEGQKPQLSQAGTPLKVSLLTNARPMDPIMMPMLTAEQRQNFTQYIPARSADTQQKLHTSSQDYARNLSAFYAQSPIMVEVTIRGNPAIMEKFNIGSPPPHSTPVSITTGAVSSSSKSTKADYRIALERDILQQPGLQPGKRPGTFSIDRQLGNESYVSTPVFAKINVKGPNVDFISNQLIDGQDFATEVLYNDYFVVFKVVNTIERGVFTQTMQLWSHNVYGGGKITTAEVLSKTPTIAGS